MAWGSGSAVRHCPHQVLADRQTRLFPPSAGVHFEIIFSGRGALVFRIDIYCRLEPVRSPPKEKKAHIDRLVNTDAGLLPYSFTVMHHKDSGSAAIKKMPVKRVNDFSFGLSPSPQIEALLAFTGVSG